MKCLICGEELNKNTWNQKFHHDCSKIFRKVKYVSNVRFLNGENRLIYDRLKERGLI